MKGLHVLSCSKGQIKLPLLSNTSGQYSAVFHSGINKTPVNFEIFHLLTILVISLIGGQIHKIFRTFCYDCRRTNQVWICTFDWFSEKFPDRLTRRQCESSILLEPSSAIRIRGSSRNRWIWIIRIFSPLLHKTITRKTSFWMGHLLEPFVKKTAMIWLSVSQ